LFWYGIERFVVEALRADSLMFGGIKVAQIVSIIFVLLGIYFMCFFKYKNEERKDTYYKGKTRYFETDDQEDLYLN
jgi:prolipoprotein diacylglyceryltransferase